MSNAKPHKGIVILLISLRNTPEICNDNLTTTNHEFPGTKYENFALTDCSMIFEVVLFIGLHLGAKPREIGRSFSRYK
jgi:hypothetical protein